MPPIRCSSLLLASAVMFAGVSTRAAQQSASPVYFFTTEPLQISEFKQCVAVQPSNPAGVWVYLAGKLGCGSRTSGPDLYHPDGATVLSRLADSIVVRFRLQRIPPPQWIDVELTIRDGYIASITGERVPVEGRDTRYIPGDDVLPWATRPLWTPTARP